MTNKKVCLYNEKYAENHGGKAQYTLNINDIIEIKSDFQLKGLTVKYYSGILGQLPPPKGRGFEKGSYPFNRHVDKCSYRVCT